MYQQQQQQQFQQISCIQGKDGHTKYITNVEYSITRVQTQASNAEMSKVATAGQCSQFENQDNSEEGDLSEQGGSIGDDDQNQKASKVIVKPQSAIGKKTTTLPLNDKQDGEHFSGTKSAPLYTQNQEQPLPKLEDNDQPGQTMKKSQHHVELKFAQKYVYGWLSEEEKYRCKKNVFKKLQKIRVLKNLERSLKLTDNDLQKYLDNWESKMPEPTYVPSVALHSGSNLGGSYYCQSNYYNLQYPYSSGPPRLL